MPRINFYHTVWRKNPTTGQVEPLEGVISYARTVDAAGVEDTDDAPLFLNRTGTALDSGTSDASGVIDYWLDPSDYTVHFEDPDVPARIDPFEVGVSGVSGAPSGVQLGQLPPLNSGVITDFTTAVQALIDASLAGTGGGSVSAVGTGAFMATVDNLSDAGNTIAAGVSGLRSTRSFTGIWNETFDYEGWFNDANGRYTPQVAGLYQFDLAVAFKNAAGTDANDVCQVVLYKNGFTLQHGGSSPITALHESPCVTASFLAVANGTTDYFMLGGSHDASVAIGVGSFDTVFSAFLVRAL